MKKISVDNIQDGMILAKDVLGSSGNALLNQGTKLTPTLGRRLKNWGIPFVLIEGEEEQAEIKVSTNVSSEEVRLQLSAKFADVIHNPIMHDIFTAVYTYKIKQEKNDV